MRKPRWYPKGLPEAKPALTPENAEAKRRPSRSRLHLRPRKDHTLAELLKLAEGLEWYGLLVTAQKEFAAQVILERYGLATYVPCRHEWRRRSKYSKAKEVKTYAVAPRYIFAGFKPGTPLWFDLFNLPLIHAAVGINGTPKPVPTVAMAQLLRKTGGGLSAPDAHRFMKTHHEFAAGDEVEVTGGPFSGWKVPVKEINGGTATVIVQLFGGAVETLDLPLELLEAAE
ncbi:transcription termination/antitermination protein NusG [Aureimonas mangrovi]|uniref:transcription termination/antitermination protein NusG n=1 Tax=Aureimonas mangrovi TaxID=2758041 RepID=UPI00163D70E8|nr:transcription termination/antitermination NusG family protein [Aureimonas mangrovi]